MPEELEFTCPMCRFSYKTLEELLECVYEHGREAPRAEW